MPAVVMQNATDSAPSAGDFFTVYETPLVIENTDMILVGAVRLRQWRIKQEDCASSFDYSPVSSLCSGDFVQGTNENTQTFYQEGYPTGVSGAYYWRTDGGSRIASKETGLRYPPSGYWTLLPPSSSQASALLSDLESSDWIDDLTAAVVVEMNVYHPFSNALVVDRILVEFPLSASVVSNLFSSPVISESVVFAPSDSSRGKALLALDIMTLLLLILGMVAFCFIAYSAGVRLFHFFWTFIDLLLIFLSLSYLAIRIDMYATMANIAVGPFPMNLTYYALSAVLPAQLSAVSLQASIVALLFIRASKFLYLGTFRIRQAFNSSFMHILGLTIVACIALIGFSLGLHVVTGFNDSVHARIDRSFIAVGLSFLNVVWVTQTVPGITSFVNMCFVFLIYLVLVPLIIVISAASWPLKPEICSASKGSHTLWIFLSRFWTSIRGKVMVDSVPDSSGIDMDLLPSIIRSGVIRRRIDLKNRILREFGFIHLDFDPARDFLPLEELKNVLIEDHFARKILGSTNPHEVIAKFTSRSNAEDPIAALQTDINRKIDSLQKTRLCPSIEVDPRVEHLAKQISDIVAHVRSKIGADLKNLDSASAVLMQSVEKISDTVKRRKNTGNTSHRI